jgi:preprotein translocase subunit SecA
MPELRPWRNADVVVRPQLERRPFASTAFDRMLRMLHASTMAPLWPARSLYAKRVGPLLTAASEAEHLSDDALRSEADRLRSLLRRDGLAMPWVTRAFALVLTATSRKLGIRHFPVQVMGGLALLDGCLVEMATGEGKTITAALPAATAALAGLPVHVITVNDYLAARDASYLAPVYEALGLRVGTVLHGLKPAERRAAYEADITYVTNKEVGFDYLRDHLARSRQISVQEFGSNSGETVLRGLGYAIVDEADSALIDEARTPLIIAERGGEQGFDYPAVLKIARSLSEGEHFCVHVARRSAQLTEAGCAALSEHQGALGGLWRHSRAREELTEQALAAEHVYQRDRHYIVRDGKVQIVDEYTGRVMEGRSWERGLHQLIEAKEAVEISAQNRTTARITYQSFFRRYVRLAGMSGTAREHAAEFRTVYGLPVVVVPTNRPVKRRCAGRSLHASARGRWAAVADAAAREVKSGRPVLIGTRSVSASEAVASILTKQGLAHTVLNARQDKGEADIVALAGQAGRITVATNMAGRGTDIQLAPEVTTRGGLHVILTEYHESSRIDRQLIGRCARQGDPGSWEAIVSIEDELFNAYAPRLRGAMRLLPPRLALTVLHRVAQWKAELRHARDRRTLLATERAARRMFAFAGEGAWL